jgi:glycosyltransferase involved in cell wall biosynthesis
MTWVLPTHNRIAFLAGTVESIREQSIKNIQIIVLDDGSDDGTDEVMEAYSTEDPRITYVRFDDRKGAARCRNHGNRMADAPWIHCADAGDVYHRNSTRIALDYLKRNPGVEIFYSSVGIVNERGNAIGEQKALPYEKGEKINFSHPTVVYSRRVAQSHMYRELSTETDLYEAFFGELSKNGVQFGYVPNTLCMKRHILDGRDMKEARKLKREIYREFGWEWPFGEISKC